MSGRDIDCLVIGGGPGGLTAATYLARFHRSVIVIDAGESRLQTIPKSRNIPGFPDGIAGPDLHERMRSQALANGAELIQGRVSSCEADGGVFHARSSAGEFRARTVILATGVEVTPPAMKDLDIAIARGLIRYCPICDGYEATDTRIGVLGGRTGSIDEAHFLLTFSSDVTYVAMPDGPRLTNDDVHQARRAGIKLESRACLDLLIREKNIEIKHASGEGSVFDVIYPCLGSRPRSELAKALGAQVSSDGDLITDPHQSTNISGLYAVGDVLRGLDQVASACGQAAIAATAIHNKLRKEFD